MSVLTGTPSVEMDSQVNGKANEGPAHVTSSVTKKKKSGKHKKDYVFKFWMALCQRCEPIINEYNAFQLMQNQRNKANENASQEATLESKQDTNDTNDPDITMTDNNETQSKPNGPDEFTFEKLGAFMGNKQLITLVGKFWAVLQSYMNNQPIRKESIKDARIILSTLMISMFPNDVLDVPDLADMDALGEACYNAAQTVMTQVFGKQGQFTDQQSGGANQTTFHLQTAHKAIDDFLNAFRDWQSQDKTKVLASLLNFYEQWRRSHQVLRAASMNQAQKDGVLETIDANISNMKQKILQLVDGSEGEMNRLCQQVDDKLRAEQVAHEQKRRQQATEEKQSQGASHASSSSSSSANTNVDIPLASAASGQPAQQANSEGASVEERLRARGVPVNMKTGKSLAGGAARAEAKEAPPSGDAKYLSEDEDGNAVLNLDSIIMEEASKRYWLDFEKEIEGQNWSRLFELLSEVLERVKKVSPKKDHAALDDMIDVAFIQQTIQNGLIDAGGFYGIFYGIWKQLRSVHAPAGDKAWDAWHDQVLKDMSKSDATWAKLLSSVFNTFLLKMDEIEDQIKAINAIKDAKK